MGLTKEVRDFFTLRIIGILDAKIAEATKGVDFKKVRQLAVSRFCDKWELAEENLIRYEELIKEIKTLEDEKEELSSLFQKTLRKAGKPVSYYSNTTADDIEKTAEEQERKDIIKELYPSVPAEIEKLEKIKNDIQGVVMLATTETKLVNRLSAVLEKYGGDVKELLDYIPKENF